MCAGPCVNRQKTYVNRCEPLGKINMTFFYFSLIMFPVYMYLRWLTAWIAMVCKRLLFAIRCSLDMSRLAYARAKPSAVADFLFHLFSWRGAPRPNANENAVLEQLGAQNLFHLVGFICLRLASEASVSEGKLNSHRHRKHTECACGVNHLRLP